MDLEINSYAIINIYANFKIEKVPFSECFCDPDRTVFEPV